MLLPFVFAKSMEKLKFASSLSTFSCAIYLISVVYNMIIAIIHNKIPSTVSLWPTSLSLKDAFMSFGIIFLSYAFQYIILFYY